jgi:hypothetical protein
MSSNRSLLHFIAGAQKTTTHDVVAPGTAPATGLNVVESAVRAKNTAQSDKTTTSVIAWPSLNSSAVDPEAHGATTTTVESVVVDGTAPPAGGLTILESKVESTDGTHAIQTVKTLTDAGGWPTLTEYHVDEQTAIVVAVQKTVVDATTITAGQAGLQTAGALSGWYVEFQPLDKFKSVRIASQVVSLPGAVTYYGSRPLSLPDTLLNIIPIWDYAYNQGGGVGTENSVSASQHVGGDLLITIKQGFRGEAVAKFTKSFSMGAPSQGSIPTPTQILPSTGTAVIISKGQQSDMKANGSSCSFSGGAEIRSKVTHIERVLTTGYAATVYSYTPNGITESSTGEEVAISASAQGSAAATVNIPASTPTSVPSGTWILDEVKVEQWRLGVWIVYTVEVLVP